MSLTSIVALLQTALMLLGIVSANPSLPQATKDNAIHVAQMAIAQATTALAPKAGTTSALPFGSSAVGGLGTGSNAAGTTAAASVSASQSSAQVTQTASASGLPYPKYWFAPLPVLPTSTGRPYTGSTDFMSLFSTNAPWTNAAGHIQVFKLYGEWLLPGNATDDELKQVVTDLKRRGIALAVEGGPLNPTDCGNGVEGFAGPQWATFMARIKAAGGTIDYIAMDEPYYFAHVYNGANACHWSADVIAQKVQTFIATSRAQFPNVVVGDTEPAVVGNAAAFQEWFDAFKRANGYALPFLHLDVQWDDANWPQLAKSIEVASRQSGVPFGMIYNADNQTTDQEWIQTAGDRIKIYELQTGGQPDQVLFQSWNDKPDYTVPESTNYTFTNYIDSYFGDKTKLGHESPIPAGIFMMGTAIFYSNGNHYCLYDNWNNFMALTGLTNTIGLSSYAQIPSTMVSDGVCTGTMNLVLNKTATSSGQVSGGESSKAFDGDSNTKWVSGGSAPQWIQVDLGAAHTIKEIKLTVEQTPDGPTTHNVYGSATGSAGSWQLLKTFQGNTTNGQVLDYTLVQSANNIRYIKVETTASPSWVAWREVQIMGN